MYFGLYTYVGVWKWLHDIYTASTSSRNHTLKHWVNEVYYIRRSHFNIAESHVKSSCHHYLTTVYLYTCSSMVAMFHNTTATADIHSTPSPRYISTTDWWFFSNSRGFQHTGKYTVKYLHTLETKLWHKLLW